MHELLISLSVLLAGTLGWWATWIDDFVIFAGIMKKTTSFSWRLKTILWLVCAVILMLALVICLVYFLNTVIDFQKYRFLTIIWWLLVWYIAYKTLKDNWSTPEEGRIWYFWLSFGSYFLNSTDDIILNFAVLRESSWINALFYIIWITIGVLLMIILSVAYTKKINDRPIIRAWILFIISVVLIINWISWLY